MVHVPLRFLSEWRAFPSAPCLVGEKKNLLTARVSMLLKSRASPDMLHFSLCNKKRLPIRHMNRPRFPRTLSIPSYDVGKYVGLRTYQQPLVLREVLWCETRSLSDGDHCWFKRSTRKKRPVTREEDDDDNNKSLNNNNNNKSLKTPTDFLVGSPLLHSATGQTHRSFYFRNGDRCHLRPDV